MGSGPSPTTPSIEDSTPETVSGERRFGRYRLCFELASGGMGTVYLARAEGPSGFEKLVALKRIHQHLAKDPRFVAMFLDEARIAARVHHPNVASVIDFGTVDGAYYLTMPFVEGESLHKVMRTIARQGDPSFVYAAARIVADACEGLHAAHELRDDVGELLEVVHRDVSPQNLLVGYDGGVRVLDFGVASARHRLYSTATGEVKGKFAYIAPEQIEGQAVDRRADVWSLGVVLWECIAQKRLFGRKTMAETVQMVLNQPVPPLRDHAPDVPLALEEIVFKALARDRDRRYTSARQMGRELLTFLADERKNVGAAEIAELMERLFPDGVAEKRKLTERARLDDALDAMLVEAPKPTPTLVAPARSRAWWPIPLAIVVALAVGAGATWWVASQPERPVETPRATAPAEEPRPLPVEEPAPVVAPAPIQAPAPIEAPAPIAEPVEREEARGRGTVTVATPGGWALVYRGNRRLGEAPGTFELPAGNQTIGVQPFGRGDIRRRRVRVPANGTVRVSIPVRE
jgi:hypothetical protein